MSFVSKPKPKKKKDKLLEPPIHHRSLVGRIVWALLSPKSKR